MKLTKRQRAAVVELLRCAADERADGIGLNGMFDASVWLRAPVTLFALAWSPLMELIDRRIAVRSVLGVVDEGYRAELLEAAQRVEEGSWP